MTTGTDLQTGVCPNCASARRGRFCPDCGQKHSPRLPGVIEYLHEISEQYLAHDGKLWRTLWLLLARPGLLTLEYVAGRRQRYVAPARLYLLFSLLFFLCLSMLANPDLRIEADIRIDASGAGAEAPTDPEPPRNDQDSVAPDPERAQEITTRVLANLLDYGPYAMFLLLPAYAGISALAFRRRGEPYALHLLLALHTHAVAFLLLSLQMALPDSVDSWIALALLAWILFALRRVFGGRWWALALRLVLIGTIYMSLLIGATATGVTLTALSLE